jgi:hypothetical protein
MKTLTINSDRIDMAVRAYFGRRCTYKKDRKTGAVTVTPREGTDMVKLLGEFRSSAAKQFYSISEQELAKGLEVNEVTEDDKGKD